MSHKILVVDDEPHIVRLIQVNLEKQGYTVITASNGKEALDSTDNDRPDLVVLDVMMPEMDGMEALKRLKENSVTHDIPVILLTAKAQDADVFEGWKSGADLYLTKPFNPSELLLFVQRIFKCKSESPSSYRIDNEEFDS